MRLGRRCASRVLVTKPAASSTAMCFETARIVIRNGSASSPTGASPDMRRSRIARRVGSASAPKVALSRSRDGTALIGFGTIWFSIWTDTQKINGSRRQSSATIGRPLEGRNGGSHGNTPCMPIARLRIQFPGRVFEIRVKSMYQLVSQVLPPSREEACSQCADVAVIFDQTYRARIGFPFNVPSA